ncbi:hypothetical protein [Proteiniphilum sp. UBA5463]|jgi:hypothetical protein|uniref:hypothetical protein n=1 Tax=Proteiniphilum sp. UBA5463 TaxID=1947281 RepID=UPI00257FF65C|nr:hypothetical protein [Proteiniphilum sp. UBA5463]
MFKIVKDMKVFTINILALLLGVSLFMSCTPIEDKETLTNTYQPEDIELSVIHSSPGSNYFTLKMNTPGVTGYWDYILGKSYGDEAKVLYPITGKQTFTYVVSSAYIPNGDLMNSEFITKTIDVDISFLDDKHPVPSEWKYLVGDGSKTWVFDKSDITRWWYMTDADPNAFWWQPDEGPSDETGRMVFSLIGSPGFTYYASPTAEPIGNTLWFVNSDWTELRLVGDANILGVEGGGEHESGGKNYRILELTENRLVLFNTPVVWSPGWVWVFKPMEP